MTNPYSNIDQTNFTEDQANLQSPPGVKPPINKPLEPELEIKPKKPRFPLKLILLAVVLIVLAISILLLLTTSATKLLPTLPSTPDATPTITTKDQVSSDQTEFGRRLLQLQSQIDAARPGEIQIKPPVMDFKLSL